MKLFESISLPKINRSTFDLTHEVKGSIDMGQLAPCMITDILPGDTLYKRTEFFLRFQALIAPVMHMINVYQHNFFVPNRLIWEDWERFITGPKDNSKEPDPVKPTFVVHLNKLSDSLKKLFQPGSLLDYLGFPVFSPQDAVFTTEATYEVDMMPVYAYYKIWHEYFRDQNLDVDLDEDYEIDILPSGVVDADGPNSHIINFYWELLKLRYRCWEKDYFTSSLPWPQKGPDVELPLTGDADIIYEPKANQHGYWHVGDGHSAADFVIGTDASSRKPINGIHYQGSTVFPKSDVTFVTKSNNDPTNDATTFSNGVLAKDQGNAYTANYDPNGTLKADLSEVTSTTINELRRATALQRWLERNAIGGNRYIETILSHFGVKSSDSRLQRPEYLGGGKAPVVISEVLQQSESTESSPLGEMGGRAVSAGKTNFIKARFEEHGFVITLMSILPRSSYFQGMPRMYNRKSRFDYAWPEFARLGEQEVLNQELLFDPRDIANKLNNKTFGYQSRYAEYKYIPNRVCGDLRTSLSFWHLGRMFANLPGLNSDFVHVKPDEVSRIFAVEKEDVGADRIVFQCLHDMKMKRKLPYYGTPY